MTTPIDPRVEPPEQPSTTQLPAVPPWAVELAQAQKDGFRVMNANIATVSNDLGVVKDRVTILESERVKYSAGVRQLSSSSAEQDAQLAQERAARETLAAKVDALEGSQQLQLAILARLDKLTSNPLVKVLAGMLLTALVTWLASKGVVVKP